jgi:hypothetical protein
MVEKTASTGPETTISTQMQQIRIKLVNAIDEALILRELLSSKSLRTCELEAALDPSSVYLLLPPNVVRQLGLRLVDQRVMRSANGQEEIVGVTEALRIEWNGKSVSEDALVMGDQVILGQGILKKLDCAADFDAALTGATQAELVKSGSVNRESTQNGLASDLISSDLTSGALASGALASPDLTNGDLTGNEADPASWPDLSEALHSSP